MRRTEYGSFRNDCLEPREEEKKGVSNEVEQKSRELRARMKLQRALRIGKQLGKLN